MDGRHVGTRRLNNWEGTVKADPAEVHAWKFGRVSDIVADMELHALKYNPLVQSRGAYDCSSETGRHMTASWTVQSGASSAAHACAMGGKSAGKSGRSLLLKV